jgi:hypothetical protein
MPFGAGTVEMLHGDRPDWVIDPCATTTDPSLQPVAGLQFESDCTMVLIATLNERFTPV